MNPSTWHPRVRSAGMAPLTSAMLNGETPKCKENKEEVSNGDAG